MMKKIFLMLTIFPAFGVASAQTKNGAAKSSQTGQTSITTSEQKNKTTKDESGITTSLDKTTTKKQKTSSTSDIGK